MIAMVHAQTAGLRSFAQARTATAHARAAYPTLLHILAPCRASRTAGSKTVVPVHYLRKEEMTWAMLSSLAQREKTPG